MKKAIIINWISFKMVIRIIPVMAGIVISTGYCVGQENDNFRFSELSGIFQTHKHEKPKYSSTNEKPKNELEFLMATGFNTYKSFFSSQDNPSCVFHPSCSSYSVQSMQQNGMFVGLLQTFDRLSRCHSFVKPSQYIFDPSKQRFHDPVQ